MRRIAITMKAKSMSTIARLFVAQKKDFEKLYTMRRSFSLPFITELMQKQIQQQLCC